MPRITQLEDDIKKRVVTLDDYQSRFDVMTIKLKESDIKNKADFLNAVEGASEVISLLYKRLKKR